jgi:chromosome partitioning protein
MFQAPSPDQEQEPGEPHPPVIALANFKGGVGKTTACINLAKGMAAGGRRVTIVDLDALATATRLLLGDEQPVSGSYELLIGHGTLAGLSLPSRIANVAVLPATALLHLAEVDAAIQSLSQEDLGRRMRAGAATTDVVLIDCGPGVGLLGAYAIAAADIVMIPVTPDPLAVAGLERTLAVAADCDPQKPVQVLLTPPREPTPESEAIVADLHVRFGTNVIALGFRPVALPPPRPAVAAA